MYWGNVSDLAEDLREGRVDEKERFKYCLAVFTSLSIVVPVFFYSVGPLVIDDLIYLIACAITGVIGIILCYRVNRSGDNVDFIPRMICLGWTVAVFSFVIMFLLPLSILSLVELAGGFQSSPALVSGVPPHIREFCSRWSFDWTPPMVAVYYGYIYFYLVRISQAKEGRIVVDIVTSNLSIGKAVLGLLMVPGIIFVLVETEFFVRRHEGLEAMARLAGFVAAALWLLLIGWIMTVLHKRSMKDA